MFDLYSERARQVIFITRLGARGAEMIDLDDLLAALIVEDQNKIPETLEMLGETGNFIGLTTHQPFLPAAATSLLESIQQFATSVSIHSYLCGHGHLPCTWRDSGGSN